MKTFSIGVSFSCLLLALASRSPAAADERSAQAYEQLVQTRLCEGLNERIYVNGRGYYGRRAISGITGTAASIIARDPNAECGRARFKSDGTRVFISNGPLWDNRVEDASGWFFTRNDDAYAGIRVAGRGYTISTHKFIWPGRKLQEVEEKNGRHLELQNMWAPIVIQMGRAADYKSFEAFQASVKARKFEYENGKLTYESEATFSDNKVEYSGPKQPRIEYFLESTGQVSKVDGKPWALDPVFVYSGPYMQRKHGESVVTVTVGGKRVLYDFDKATITEAGNSK